MQDIERQPLLGQNTEKCQNDLKSFKKYFALSAFSFGTSVFSFILFVNYIPSNLESIVGPEKKASALGILSISGGILQSFASLWIGMVSEKGRTRFGKRKPFITFGALISCLGLCVLGCELTFASYVITYCTIMLGSVSYNISFNGLVADLTKNDEGWISALIGSFGLAGNLVGAILGSNHSIMNPIVFRVLIMLIMLSGTLLILIWANPTKDSNIQTGKARKYCILKTMKGTIPFNSRCHDSII